MDLNLFGFKITRPRKQEAKNQNFVTPIAEDGATTISARHIGINVGGLVIVRPLRDWHAAMLMKPMTADEADAAYEDAPAIPMTDEEIEAYLRSKPEIYGIQEIKAEQQELIGWNVRIAVMS